MAKPKKTAKKHIDIDNEDAVLAEMAKALEMPEEDLSIEPSSLESFGEGTAKTISSGRQEWTVVENDDVAEAIAKASVKQDLEESPENFEPNFIESHIDVDRLRKELHSDVYSSNYDYASEIGDERFWDEAERWGIDVPDEDENGERPEPTSTEYDKMAEGMTEEQLKDPMEYLADIYGREDSMKKAIEIAGIDEESAADEAVRVDGWQHFLSGYDGESYTTPNGLVYWRNN